MKNYLKPELNLIEILSHSDVLSNSIDLTESDYFDFTNNPWGGQGV